MEKSTKRSRAKRDPNKDLILSPGEKALLWRRRSGYNQTQMAHKFKLSLFKYKLFEYDELKQCVFDIPPVGILQSHEKCFLYRKRSGRTQSSVAAELGIGRYWLRLQEVGKVSCTKLLAWWESGG